MEEDKGSVNSNDNGDHIVEPNCRFKIMSYNGAQISIHLMNRGSYDTTLTILDAHPAKETKWLIPSEFIDIKSMTDNLYCIEILSKYYERLGIDPANNIIRVNSVESDLDNSDDSFWSLQNTDLIKKSLIARNKHEKLNCDQIGFLRNKLDCSELSLKEISSKFFVSQSNLRRIKNLDPIQILDGPKRPPLRLFGQKHIEIKRDIKFYYKNWEFPLTVGDVKQFVNDDRERGYTDGVVRGVMIRDLNLSYKQCKSRPYTFNIAKARASRKLF